MPMVLMYQPKVLVIVQGGTAATWPNKGVNVCVVDLDAIANGLPVPDASTLEEYKECVTADDWVLLQESIARAEKQYSCAQREAD